MKTLKNYIVETIKQNEDIALDTYINEGFLDKLKDAINTVVDNPKKYFDKAKENIEELKKRGAIKNTIYMKEPEKVAEEMDKLNNDEDLKAIYKHAKQIVADKDSELYDSLIVYNIGSEKILEYIKKNFDNCDDNKAYAICQIMNALGMAILTQKDSKKSSSSSYGGSRSKAAGRVAMTSAIAIALR